MMTNSVLENLRSLAVTNGEVAFSHLVTAAINGEEFAVTRMEDFCAHVDGFSSQGVISTMATWNTDRPDGAVARCFKI